MPSFDIVSEVDMHEATNAVDQANKEVSTRFDFKGFDVKFELADSAITQSADSDFQLTQMLDILYSKLSKRGVELACIELGKITPSGKQVKQILTIKQGIDTDLSKKIVKMIKAQKLKVQAAIQGEKVRVTGKKRDDLQQTIQFLRSAELEFPLQFENFRD